MLDSGLVEAVIVSVPHYDHPRYAIECLKRRPSTSWWKSLPASYTKQVREMNERRPAPPPCSA